jgi:hypothetical protein
MAFISDINDQTPTNADQRSAGAEQIRTLKEDVHDSFPNIDAEVGFTAAQLNAVLTPVDLTGLADADILVYNAALPGWVPVTPVDPVLTSQAYSYLNITEAQEATIPNENAIYFTGSPTIDEVTASGLATITNNSADGFYITPVSGKKISVAISYSDNEGLAHSIGLAVGGDKSAIPSINYDSGNLRAYTISTQDASTSGVLAATVILDSAGTPDQLWINVSVNWASDQDCILHMVVTEVA